MKRGMVRIIAGKWRGRQLKIPEVDGLRPTPDRVRETLFNWLAVNLPKSRCLDLFAGSGALGLEALSRGASYVEMVDASTIVCKHLKSILGTLNAENAKVFNNQIPNGLMQSAAPFDIVFIDPPYQAGLIVPTCAWLEKHHFLSADALIYLEANAAITEDQLPSHWQLIKCKKAGNVYYHLAKRNNHDKT